MHRCCRLMQDTVPRVQLHRPLTSFPVAVSTSTAGLRRFALVAAFAWQSACSMEQDFMGTVKQIAKSCPFGMPARAHRLERSCPASCTATALSPSMCHSTALLVLGWCPSEALLDLHSLAPAHWMLVLECGASSTHCQKQQRSSQM